MEIKTLEDMHKLLQGMDVEEITDMFCDLHYSEPTDKKTVQIELLVILDELTNRVLYGKD